MANKPVSDQEREIAQTYSTYHEAVEVGGFTRSYQSWSSLRKPLSASTIRADAEEVLQLQLPSRGEMDPQQFLDAVKAVTELKRQQMDRITEIPVTLEGGQWVGIVFLGDIHIGGLIEYDLLERDLSVLQQTDGLYAVGTGDYGDFFGSQPKLSHAMSESTLPSSEDELMLVTYLLDIARGKWIAVGAGNHDDWGGVAAVEHLAKSLGTAYFSQAGAALKITVGSERYVGYVKHQWQGHSNISTANESRRFWQEFAEWENADFTVLAHYHQPDTHVRQFKGQHVSLLRGGTYKTNDYYAQKAGYVPDYGPSIVLLSPDEHKCVTIHGPDWLYGVELLGHLRGECGSPV